MSSISDQQLLEQAVAHHRDGRLSQAEMFYRQFLSQQPNHPDALRLLGVLAHQSGHTETAVELIQRSLKIHPRSPDGYAALGQVLAGAGKLAESAAAFQQARALDPGSPELCNDLGNVLLGLGRLDEAMAMYHRALSIRPGFPEALSNLGTVLMQQGRFDEAIGACQRALLLRPNFVEAQSNLGSALRQASRHGEAVAVLEQALKTHPHNKDALMILAETLREMGRLDDALSCVHQVLSMYPQLAEAHNALGVIHFARREFEPAIIACQQAIALQPDLAEAHYNLASVLHEKGDEEEAIAAFEHALRLKPDMYQAYNNMGNALLNIGRYAESVAAQRKALALKPALASAHFNLGVALLVQGDLLDGFKEFEWRWITPELSLSRRRFAQPRWNGESLDGKTILLHAEQGFGDTIQFIRYLPKVAEFGAKIVLACQSELSRLLSQLPGIEKIVTEKDRLPHFDVHCALMSLPLVLGTMMETIPANIPYLRADASLSDRWRERVNAECGMRNAEVADSKSGFGIPHSAFRKIGLAWAGRPTHSHDRSRSIPLSLFAPLSQVPNACFLSLQKSAGSDQAKSPPAGMDLIDWTDELHDFTDTAALIENLDLLITADTAVAHLAGAMGKRVLLLLPFAPDWRWMLEREDSPWYPTMRLFRQTKMGDWDGPIRRIVEALEQM